LPTGEIFPARPEQEFALMNQISRLRPGGRRLTVDETISFCCDFFRLLPVLTVDFQKWQNLPLLLLKTVDFVGEELRGTGLYGVYSALTFYCHALSVAPDPRPWPLDLPDDDPEGVASRWNFLFIEQAANFCDSVPCFFFSFHCACASAVGAAILARIDGRWPLSDHLDGVLTLIERRLDQTPDPTPRSVVGILELVNQLTRPRNTAPCEHSPALMEIFLRHLISLPPIARKVLFKKWDYACFAPLHLPPDPARRLFDEDAAYPGILDEEKVAARLWAVVPSRMVEQSVAEPVYLDIER
jgi:hypothetical protein